MIPAGTNSPTSCGIDSVIEDNVIIIKTKVLLSQAKVTLADFGYPV
jgi:hypothetical protein